MTPPPIHPHLRLFPKKVGRVSCPVKNIFLYGTFNFLLKHLFFSTFKKSWFACGPAPPLLLRTCVKVYLRASKGLYLAPPGTPQIPRICFLFQINIHNVLNHTVSALVAGLAEGINSKKGEISFSWPPHHLAGSPHHLAGRTHHLPRQLPIQRQQSAMDSYSLNKKRGAPHSLPCQGKLCFI